MKTRSIAVVALVAFTYTVSLAAVRMASPPTLMVTGAPASATFGVSFVVSTTGGLGTGAVTFSTSGACSNTAGGAFITMTSGTGDCTIQATKDGDGINGLETSDPVTVTATMAEQSEVTPSEANQSAIPGLGFGEFVAGLQTAGSHTFLFTTLTWYTSPVYNGGNLNFVASGFLFQSLSVIVGTRTRVAHNPADSASERIFYLTGGAGAFGNSLYTLRLPSSGSPDAEEVAIALEAKPNGIAVSPTGVVYLLCGGCSPVRVVTVDPSNGQTSAGFGTTGAGTLITPTALAIGPTGIVYVLDEGDAQIKSYDAAGVYLSSFAVANPPALTGEAAMVIGPDHRLYVTSGQYVSVYDAVTGTYITAFDRTADQGFNDTPNGHPAIALDSNGYGYDFTATGQFVHVFTTQQPDPLSVTGAPSSEAFGASFVVATTGGLGTGAVTFHASGACSNTDDGALITMTSGTGTCSIDATKAGDANYAASTSAAVNVGATKATQATLTLTGVPATAADGSAFTVTPGGGSSSAPLVVSTTGVCSALGNVITMTSGTGTCTVNVNRAGDSDYAAATEVSASATATSTTGGLTVTVLPVSVLGGKSATATVTLQTNAPKGGAIVTLSSSHPAVAAMPATMRIPPNALSKTFNITTSGVGEMTDVVISASYQSSTGNATLRVTPPALKSLTLSKATIPGGTSVTGTVTLTGVAPAGGAVITLESTQPMAGQVPETVTIPAGATSKTFTITTTPVAVNTVTAISVSYLSATNSLNLTVTAPVLTGLTLTPPTVKGGNSSVATVTLSGPAPVGGFLVALNSDKTEAQLQGSVLVAAGATSAQVTVTTIKVTAKIPAKITASAGGTSKTATLTINK